MNFLIFLGLVVFAMCGIVRWLTSTTQSPQSRTYFADTNSFDPNHWNNRQAQIDQGYLSKHLIQESALNFLACARERLARAYGEMAIEGEQPPDLLKEAFSQSWENTCRLADAKFGELTTTGVLIELGFDRPQIY